MRAVVQRVSEARVVVDGEVVGEIGRGLCVLLGVARDDGDDEALRLAEKVAKLRIFEKEDGRFDRSVLDAGGAAIVVSQFTLIADSKRQRGTRPDFSGAARPEVAEPLYERFCAELRARGVPVETGAFGARMAVELVNDGPVTIVLDTQTGYTAGRWRLMARRRKRTRTENVLRCRRDEPRRPPASSRKPKTPALSTATAGTHRSLFFRPSAGGGRNDEGEAAVWRQGQPDPENRRCRHPGRMGQA